VSAAWEAQKALYDALAADAAYMALIGNDLYDEPPVNEPYPYVVIGDTVEVEDNRLASLGYETVTTIHIHTQPKGLGFYPAKKILEQQNTVLNMKVGLAMPTLYMTICQYEGMMTERDGDKRIISARYRVLSQ
jgi:hypothetical protein